MAGLSLLTLLDDIVAVLDDVALMSKVAAKKTAGVLGDDLALNAQQVSGVQADRELPVVWAVAKGSFLNKAIIVPVALALSAFLPIAITILLLLGGLYLCFEGFEKVYHVLFHANDKESEKHKQDHINSVANPACNLVELEKEKIKLYEIDYIYLDSLYNLVINGYEIEKTYHKPFVSKLIIEKQPNE